MRRRELIAPLGAAAWPLAARAQQSERLPRVGLLMAYANDDENQISVPFRKRLEELGWIDGRNVRIEGRSRRIRRPRRSGLRCRNRSC
jgi:putative tryptophan/tyrosine transport system substrate-binding protein